jgi:adenylosuccinate lyase
VIARYARPEMSRIWSEEGKLAGWLEVELAALEGWAEVGAVPAEDVAAIRAGASAHSSTQSPSSSGRRAGGCTTG